MAEDYSHLVRPTVNLNGTAKTDLMHQYISALNALDVLKGCLAAMSPHGRDYQTMSEDAYYAARMQHDRRRKAVDWIYKEVVYLAEKL